MIVLPSGYGETWGLVINEAIEYGLPVIVSDMVGCSIDLCNNNGYIFKYKDITDLTSKLKKIYSLDDKSYDKLVRNSYIIKNKLLLIFFSPDAKRLFCHHSRYTSHKTYLIIFFSNF